MLTVEVRLKIRVVDRNRLPLESISPARKCIVEALKTVHEAIALGADRGVAILEIDGVDHSIGDVEWSFKAYNPAKIY